MFTIGQTSGVASCSSPEPEPCTSIKNYLCKMAKCACDLPCPHVAATKVVEVSQGSFCKGTVLKTASYTIDTGGGGSGCCGGSSCSGCGGCCGKSCCGGNNTSPSNPAQPAATGCSGANCQASGTSASRGGVDQNGNTGNAGQNPNYNDTVTPGIGTTNSQTGASFDLPDETETADVINFAVEHAIEGVKVARDGFSWVTDPVYEASKVITNADPTSPRMSPLIPVPSSIEDILNSSYPGQIDNQYALAQDFRRSMCDRRPFPECEACIYSRQVIEMTPIDLYDLLYGIKCGLDAIAKGQCAWGEQMFNCPGQVAAMLRQALGPLGEIVGPAAAGVMIGMTAVHGALSAYGHLAHTFVNTPFRGELLGSIGDAMRSGGCPGSYHRMMGNILQDLHLPASSLFTSSPMGVPGGVEGGTGPSGLSLLGTAALAAGAVGGAILVSKFGGLPPPGAPGPHVYPATGYVPGGFFGGGPLLDMRTTRYGGQSRSIARIAFNPSIPPPRSVAAAEKFNSVRGQVDMLIDASRAVLDNPLAYEREVGAHGGQGVVAVSKVPTTDTKANPGVTYYKPWFNSDRTSTFVPIDIEPGTDLDISRAELGCDIFVDAPDTVADELIRGASDGSTDTRLPGAEPGGQPIVGGKGTHDRDVDEDSADAAMATIPRKDDSSPDLGGGIATTPKRNKPENTEIVRHPFDVADDGYDYFVKDDEGNLTEIDISDLDDGAGGKKDMVGAYLEAIEQLIGKEVYVAVPKEDDSFSLPIDGPLVFPNGLMLEPVVPMGASALNTCVDTDKLVTATHIPASEMAQLYGIGLSVDEIKVAYALDNDMNGSRMPKDCHAVRIPTILDTLPDDEYD